ncbi:MAG: hypothetical protein HY905_03775 [Deltaproteobacteria bacterium]|nr:hypothetical protein [Deltaproteobacteria bacterium]
MATDRTGVMIEGKYRLVRRLGEGGMGVVHEARHAIIDRRCAVKLIHPEIAANPDIPPRTGQLGKRQDRARRYAHGSISWGWKLARSVTKELFASPAVLAAAP